MSVIVRILFAHTHGFHKTASRALFEVFKMLAVLKYALNTVLWGFFLGLKKISCIIKLNVRIVNVLLMKSLKCDNKYIQVEGTVKILIDS